MFSHDQMSVVNNGDDCDMIVHGQSIINLCLQNNFYPELSWSRLQKSYGLNNALESSNVAVCGVLVGAVLFIYCMIKYMLISCTGGLAMLL